MISNVSNNLKKRIIKNEMITKEEAEIFIKYMINKTILITDRMYQKNKNYMNLFFEIALSYNLPFEFIAPNKNGGLINIGGFTYIVDVDLKTSKYPNLSKNKYIEYTKNNFIKYMELSGDNSE